MIVRRAIFVALALVLLYAVAHYLMRFVPRLQFNRAVYALNQGNYSEAAERLRRLQDSDPDRAEVQIRLGESLLRQQQAREAAAQLAGIQTKHARKEYLLGISEYLSNSGSKENESQSLKRLNLTTSSLEQLTHSERQLARLAAAASSADSRVDNDDIPVPEQSVEKALWYSWNGRIAMRLGQWEQAATMLGKAISLHDTNQRTRRLAAASSALQADYAEAQYFIDTATSPSASLLAVTDEIETAIGDRETSAVTYRDVARALALNSTMQRTTAWLRLQRHRHGVVLSSDPAEPSNDAMATMLDADLLVLEQRFADAYKLYSSPNSGFGNLQLLLRQHDVSGVAEAPHRILEGFAEGIIGAFYIPASETSCTVPLSDKGVAQFRKRGSMSAVLALSGNRQYRLSIVAASDHADNVGPVVAVSVEGFPSERVYVAREGWDCYVVDKPLNGGEQKIKLEYSSNADAVSGQGENRSLYISGILVEPLREHNP